MWRDGVSSLAIGYWYVSWRFAKGQREQAIDYAKRMCFIRHTKLVCPDGREYYGLSEITNAS